jgi:hypothetical protein
MAAKDIAPDIAPLPASLTLGASYSGFWPDGGYYAYDAGSVIADPSAIAYFMGRTDAIYTVPE